MNLSVEHTYNASSHVCCVETPSFASDVIALGLYELEDGDTQLRNGKMQILSPSFDIISHATFACGVLDMKWKDRMLACALSDGTVNLLTFDEHMNIIQSSTIESEGEGFALSIDWNHLDLNGGCDVLAVSTQQGSVYVYEIGSSVTMKTSFRNMHKLGGEMVPAWITAQSTTNEHVLMSGGDDACMKIYDSRSEVPVHVDRRTHTAGVTSAQWHPERDVFATGSYDGFVRIWDARSLRSVLLEQETGGGVWRLKWSHEKGQENKLLAACMHAGAFVLHVNTDEGICTVTESMVDNDADRLVYGADWLGEGGIAISSFYKDIVQIWR